METNKAIDIRPGVLMSIALFVLKGKKEKLNNGKEKQRNFCRIERGVAD